MPMRLSVLVGGLTLFLVLVPCVSSPAGEDAGDLVRVLWLVQRHGRPEAVRPENDQKVKGLLARAIGKDGVFTTAGVQTLMDTSNLDKFAGADGRLDPSEVRQVLDADVPESRKRLLPSIKAHAELLTTGFDQIDGPHREAGAELVNWIARNHEPGKPLHVTVICTGNSRRSIIGATMGNIAAAYYGMPEVRFHSGGTAPSAFNARSIATLRQIGVKIEPTGEEARRGEPKTKNPVYRVSWGEAGEPSLETAEFSKVYDDPCNPQSDFAALLVCGEADAACPRVKGASIRISMPYLDPKIFDDSVFESVKYAERRDDIGRLMLSVMMQVRNRLGR